MKTLLLENTENVRYCNHHLVSVKLGLSEGKERLQGPNKRKEGRRREVPPRPGYHEALRLQYLRPRAVGVAGHVGPGHEAQAQRGAQLEQARVRLALKGTLPLVGVTPAFRQSYLTYVCPVLRCWGAGGTQW